jgi:hypothetical protein
MLAIVRVRVWLKEKGTGGVAAYKPENLQKLWDYVITNRQDWENTSCQMVYITHRDMREDISLFINGKDMDSISGYVLKHVAPLKYIRSLKFISLMNPRFFPIPKGTFRHSSRYTIAVSCEPSYVTKTFDTLSSYKANESIVPNYIAYTLRGEGGDIFVSYSCKGDSTMKGFVDRYVVPIEGVTGVRTTRISKTKRLVSPQEWTYLFEQFVPEVGVEIEEIEDFEDDQISAC